MFKHQRTPFYCFSTVVVFLATWIFSLPALFAAPDDVEMAFDAGTIVHSSENARVFAVAVQTDGKIFAVGNFGMINSTVRVCLASFNGDGSLDSFYQSGTPSDTNHRDRATIGQVDNKYLIGGDLTAVAGISRQRLARLDDLAPQVFADFDGTGRADLSVFRFAVRNWYINGSRACYYGIQSGLPSDKLVPADYDGDGRTDLAIYRNGVWWFCKAFKFRQLLAFLV